MAHLPQQGLKGLLAVLSFGNVDNRGDDALNEVLVVAVRIDPHVVPPRTFRIAVTKLHRLLDTSGEYGPLQLKRALSNQRRHELAIAAPGYVSARPLFGNILSPPDAKVRCLVDD